MPTTTSGRIAHEPRTDVTAAEVLRGCVGLMVDTRTAALALGCPPQTLRALAAHPERPSPIQPVRMGASVRYRLADIRLAVGLPPLTDEHLGALTGSNR